MSTINKTIEMIANDLTYMPNHEQRKVKSAFWMRFNENPICEADSVTLSIALSVVSDGRLDKWWTQAGFKEWFRNQEEFRERVESMAHLALDTLMMILVTDDPKAASARVSAAKLLLEVARKLPKAASEMTYKDDKISGMDRKQLDAYISRQMRLLPAPPEPEIPLDNDPN